jgi:hypothetical protein
MVYVTRPLHSKPSQLRQDDPIPTPEKSAGGKLSLRKPMNDGRSVAWGLDLEMRPPTPYVEEDRRGGSNYVETAAKQLRCMRCNQVTQHSFQGVA